MIFIEHIFSLSNFKKIIFIDRDGILNANLKNYIKSKLEINIIEKSVEAMNIFSKNNIGFIIITNQQVIGKKIISLEKAISINNSIVSYFNKKFNCIIASFICPHLKSDGCLCRKPGTKMIEIAFKLFDIKKENTFLIGDSISDIETAKKLNLRPIFINENSDNYIDNVISFSDLLQAAKYIILSNKT